MSKLKQIVLIIISTFLISGCMGDNDVKEFNKSALYWYNKIAHSINSSNIDKADNYYISLKSEHIQSPLLQTAIMMLANAHMNEEEYLLANFYFDEYKKRYGENINREYIDFMKLKASFMGIQEVYKDQQLIQDTIDKALVFSQNYPSSQYLPLIDTILIRLYMGQYMLHENIAALYDRLDKPKAAKVYRDKNKNSIIQMSDIKVPPKTIIGKILD
jgi:outer membrane protein assembly factor BamD